MSADELAARLSAGEAAGVHERIAAVIRRTPVLSSRGLSERVGGEIVLKAESLQRTGSFKLRGALNRLASVDPRGPGVVAASAGNHGQAVAYAARGRGIRCTVLMPVDAPVAKVAAVQAFGAAVELTGTTVEDCLGVALRHQADTGAELIHPYEDPEVVLGQATLGVELHEDVAELASVLVPIGGGGLISGVSGALRAARPGIRIVGVRAAARPTIADGIGIKSPGPTTAALIERWVDDVVAVEEDDIAEAMVWLLERAKLVVEGAGAVGVAALLSGTVHPIADGPTAVILSGGNVDPGLLGAIAARHEAAAGRRLRLFTRIPDRPGGLAALLDTVARSGANVVAAEHVRDSGALHVRETGVELSLETRGTDHAAAILAALRDGGYEAFVLDGRPGAPYSARP